MLALIVVGCTFGPFREQLHLLPWHEDTERWVGRASLDYELWWQWLFFTRHWVGWRPVTAVSFLLNNLTTGYSIFAYQLTDLVLQCLAAASLAWATRSVTQAHWGVCVLASALFCLHPVMEEVVPWLDMRSYRLAMLFGNLALADFANGLREGRLDTRRRATLWMVLALLSNEFSFVLLPLLPVIGWLHGRSRREVWDQLKWLGLWAVLIAVVRYPIVQHLGGYTKPMYAYLKANGSRGLIKDKPFPRIDVFAKAWEYSFFPSTVNGQRSVFTVGSGMVGGALIAGWFAWAALWRPLREPELRVRWVLVLWLFGYSLLWTLDGSWFWRLGFPMVMPMAMLTAVLVGDAVTAAGWPRRLGYLVAPGLLIAGWAALSPVTNGYTAGSLKLRRQATEAMHMLEAQIRELDAKRVYVVVPFKKEYAQRVVLWAQFRLGTDVDLRLLASSKPSKGHKVRSRIVDVDGRSQLQLATKHMVWTPEQPIRWRATPKKKTVTHPRSGSARPLFLDRLYTADTPTAYVWIDGKMRSGAVAIPAP